MSGKCNALLMADKVIREDNGKVGIIGSFNTLNLPIFPIMSPPFMIYANLEDFSGEQEFSINIVKDGSDLVILSQGGEIKFSGDETDLIIPIMGLRIPKDGIYQMILNVGGYQYGSRRIIINKIPMPQTGGPL
jgi:hypothetical protein